MCYHISRIFDILLNIVVLVINSRGGAGINSHTHQFHQRLTLEICTGLDIEDTLGRGFRYLKKYIPADGMTFDVTKPDGSLMSIARVTPDGVDIHDVPVPLSSEARENVRDTENAEDIEIFNAPDRNPTSRDFSRHFGLEAFSCIVVNLISENEFQGWLAIYAFGVNQYTNEDAEFLSRVKAPLSIAMSNALKYREIQKFSKDMETENQELYQELMHASGSRIIGAESGLKEVTALVKKVSPTDTPVVLLGETGVGKDVMANAIHLFSNRKTGPIIKVNCGAIPRDLIDSELFGHEKGAFTGATARKRGKFERADRGTLFLDEIGELSLDAQVRLLRAIQFREIERVGGTSTVNADVRIIAATHRNLEELIAAGRFREDLYYRLNVFPIHIPPLRQRKEDIPALVHYLMEKKSRELNFSPSPELPLHAMAQLMDYDWPGNVRELSNIIERSLILNRNAPLAFDPLKTTSHPATAETRQETARDTGIIPLNDVIAQHIRKALIKSAGRIEGPKGAAKLLDLHPSTLRSKIKKFNIQFKRPSGRR